jgi:hypothetical protein
MALSVRRIMLLVMVVAVMATMLVVGSALQASANPLERANTEACQGLVIAALSTSNDPEGPFTPPKAAEYLSEEDDVVDVKTYIKGVREGRFFVEFDDGETFGCPVPPPEEE